jgi:hypothetical protein
MSASHRIDSGGVGIPNTQVPNLYSGPGSIAFADQTSRRKDGHDMSQRSRIKLLTAGCVAVLVVGTVASGQEKVDPQNRRSITTSEWPSLKGVLAIGEVRNLLELTDDEQDEVRLFVDGKRPRRRDDDEPTTATPPPPDAPGWQMELYRQERRLKRILGDERYTRIRQIQAQAGGLPGAMTREDPSTRLEVTAEQRSQARKELRTVADKMADRFHEIPRGAYDKQAKLRTEMYDDVAPQLMAILTDEQKAKWAEMTGEPADPELILRIRTLGGR